MWTTGCDHEQVCNVCISAFSRIFFGANAQNCQGGALSHWGPLAGQTPLSATFSFLVRENEEKMKIFPPRTHARLGTAFGTGITTDYCTTVSQSNTTAHLRGTKGKTHRLLLQARASFEDFLLLASTSGASETNDRSSLGSI
jgi:hypothetical protein